MKARVLGLGELLWDVFESDRKPGGAPANVAFQLNQLGLEGAIASRVGEDALGDEILDFLRQKSVSTEFVQRDPAHSTGKVSVTLDSTGTPSYIIHEDAAWDFLEFTPQLQSLLPTLSAVCFGTLGQRTSTSHTTIQKVLAAVPSTCLKVYDVNLRQHFYSRELLEESFQHANVAKMNDQEMQILSPILNVPSKSDPKFFAERLIKQYGLSQVCITRAEKGCLLFDQNLNMADIPGKNVNVADTVGSGDSFSAALIYAILTGCNLETQAAFANDVGTLVATRAGGMPSLTLELAELKAKYGI